MLYETTVGAKPKGERLTVKTLFCSPPHSMISLWVVTLSSTHRIGTHTGHIYKKISDLCRETQTKPESAALMEPDVQRGTHEHTKMQMFLHNTWLLH